MRLIIKGIVEEYIDRDNIKVRVPQLHGIKGDSSSTKTSSLPNATMCTLPNCEIKLATDDIVYVEFENLEWGKPVIVGFLDIKSNSKIMLTISELTAEDKVILPKDTTIGNITPNEIDCLSGLETNVQEYINNTSPVVILDLSMYEVGDEIPFSIINSISNSAMVFAKREDEFNNLKYYTLIEKSKPSSLNETSMTQIEKFPTFNYYFSNGIEVISIVNGVLE